MALTYGGKRKRKDFLRHQNKKAAQINYGKGHRLSDEEYQYYTQILEHLEHVGPEEKDLLAKGLLKEIQKEDQVKYLVTNQIASSALEKVLPFAPVLDVLAIGNVFLENLRVYCIDPFASHVLQTLLTLCFRLCQDEPFHGAEISDKDVEDPEKSGVETQKASVSPEQKRELEAFILKTSKFVCNNLIDFVLDTYGSHVVCSVLEVCSGIDVSSRLEVSKKLQNKHLLIKDRKQILVVSDEQKALMVKFGERLMKLPNFVDVICSICGSVVLQTSLLIFSTLKNEHLTSMLVNHIIEHGFKAMGNECNDYLTIHPLFEVISCARLMEVVLSVSSQSEREQLFETFYRDQMKEIVRHKTGNFSVQRLLSSWEVKNSFVNLYDSIKENLREAYSVGHTGVLYAFVQACRKLSFNWKKCIKHICGVLGVEQNDSGMENLWYCLLYFIPLEEYRQKQQPKQLPPLSYHGTLILQEFLLFKNPSSVVKAMLNLVPSQLVKMACDFMGSRVYDVFTTSPYISAENKKKLIHQLKNHFAMLACSRFGSRSLESLWAVAALKTKIEICQELERSPRLRENEYGFIIYNKFMLQYFNKHEIDEWKKLQEENAKKKKNLKDFLAEIELA